MRMLYQKSPDRDGDWLKSNMRATLDGVSESSISQSCWVSVQEPSAASSNEPRCRAISVCSDGAG